MNFDKNIPTSQVIIDKANEVADSINPFSFDASPERASPSDWIKEEQIEVWNDRIVIDLKGAYWAAFTNTNSMDPIIDEHANAIEIVPENEAQIEVGDIVSYESEYADGTIIHRVIYKGQDEKGTYFIMKGDNNPSSDPGKIRFNQIKRVLVAIIY
ncbi:MAG: hypothetical protein ABIC91_07355 [Nanoarchaeota archaeon]|nr:hypothetical protein [Nanoarchaeota archaeon]MBU1031220.1 hypothetical protein [Nanoarchaeota archaeon]